MENFVVFLSHNQIISFPFNRQKYERKKNCYMLLHHKTASSFFFPYLTPQTVLFQFIKYKNKIEVKERKKKKEITKTEDCNKD